MSDDLPPLEIGEYTRCGLCGEDVGYAFKKYLARPGVQRVCEHCRRPLVETGVAPSAAQIKQAQAILGKKARS